MKVLIIGSGGREHALAKACLASSYLEKLFLFPMIDALQDQASCLTTEKADLIPQIQNQKIDFVIIGPEAYLAEGLADQIREIGIPVFGPSADASQLESSKVFAKEFCKKHHIPTPDYETFTVADAAKAFFHDHDPQDYVIKASGLAGGKGSFLCESREEAYDKIDFLMTKKGFGAAGEKVLIEKRLRGQEVSVFISGDDTDFFYWPVASDHKRLSPENEGPNTGSMGAYSPPTFWNEDLQNKVHEKITRPTWKGITENNWDYRGTLYFGIMIDENDEPFLLEYNVRFGDPEAQVILPLANFDVLSTLHACADGNLKTVKDQISFSDKSRFALTLASEGYPFHPIKREVIKGLGQTLSSDVEIYHAGTKKDGDYWITNGGRVLTVCASGGSLQEAREKVYKMASKISWGGLIYRKDI
jgi:phosphoribosylamine--glycine ligase